MRNAREEKMWDFSLILITTSSSFRFSENCFQSAPELRLLTFMFSEEKILRNSQEILKSCSNLRHLFHNNCFYRVVATLSEKTLIKSAGYMLEAKWTRWKFVTCWRHEKNVTRVSLSYTAKARGKTRRRAWQRKLFAQVIRDSRLLLVKKEFLSCIGFLFVVVSL